MYQFQYTVIKTDKLITVTVNDRDEALLLYQTVAYLRSLNKDVTFPERIGE